MFVQYVSPRMLQLSFSLRSPSTISRRRCANPPGHSRTHPAIRKRTGLSANAPGAPAGRASASLVLRPLGLALHPPVDPTPGLPLSSRRSASRLGYSSHVVPVRLSTGLARHRVGLRDRPDETSAVSAGVQGGRGAGGARSEEPASLAERPLACQGGSDPLGARASGSTDLSGRGRSAGRRGPRPAPNHSQSLLANGSRATIGPGPGGETADAVDSKSTARKGMRVRVPPRAPAVSRRRQRSRCTPRSRRSTVRRGLVDRAPTQGPTTTGATLSAGRESDG